MHNGDQWRQQLRQAERRARTQPPERAAELLRNAAALARGRDDALAEILLAKAEALLGDRQSAIDRLFSAWQRWPEDLRIVHNLAAARRATEPQGASRPCQVWVCATVGRYRQLASELPQPGEAVIEIGCAQGYATARLADRAGVVVAIDVSREMVETCRKNLAGRPNVHILCADARDPSWPGVFLGRADLIFIDVAGSAPARHILRLARDYRLLYRPRAMVIRNVELNDFCSALAGAETQAQPQLWRRDVAPPERWPW